MERSSPCPACGYDKYTKKETKQVVKYAGVKFFIKSINAICQSCNSLRYVQSIHEENKERTEKIKKQIPILR